MTAVDILKDQNVSNDLRTSPPSILREGCGLKWDKEHPPGGPPQGGNLAPQRDNKHPYFPERSHSPLEGGQGGVHGVVSTVEDVITISDLRFRWSQKTPIVLDIEALQIQQGERVFIAGPSGSGKSTLLSLLAGVVTPQQGQISVLGQCIDQLNSVKRDHVRSDHIGFIFQMFNLIPYLSVVENVTLPCQFSKRRRAKVLNRASSLKEEALRLLAHLDMAEPELLNRPVTDLSVGQQQRVAAARALIGAPEIVIADEPTSSLDADLREAFVKLLFQECQQEGSTLVFVSHDVFLESFFDRTIRLAEINQA